ncbi:hypothetical protein [Pseudoxanthomonas mexicana]|uniref:hypothetical protein n=1 Tax=Pseudoxanthomonas mexicana TaxID=128785 RepID=UPI0022F3814B|nr:hypothetical protein [Pseudoxanthomonas mexicana]WBX92838.1 hypothetical protein PE064_14170 [Pseudoxanthomonas mexicana]
MALPQSYRWSDNADGGANLYQNYACVAAIKADGTTKLKWWQKEFHSKAASVAQAKRFIERWINARNSPRAYECARWRNRYAKAAAPPPARRQGSALDYNRLLQPTSSAISTRAIMVDAMPDDFESIADVGQPLQRFAKSSGLNVTAKATHAPLPQRGTGKVAHSRHAPR